MQSLTFVFGVCLSLRIRSDQCFRVRVATGSTIHSPPDGVLWTSNETFQPVGGERIVSIYVEAPEILPGHFQSTLHRKYGLARRCFAIQEAYLSKRKTASQQHIKSPNPRAERLQP